MSLYNFEFVSMTTPCKFKVYKGSREKALKCFEEIKKNTLYLEKKYNFYNKDSYINKTINRRSKNKIKIDSQTASILKTVKDLSLKVNKHFDITIGTLKKCYEAKTKDNMISTLEELLPRTGFDSWDIENRFLSFKYDETIIDLGGVIKEYAVDEAVKIAKKHKIDSAIINFGGDMYCIGRKPDNTPFSIAVKNPLDKTNSLVSINLENQALTTSANYERSFKIEGEEFSHIISKTKPNKDILSATIISKSVLECGIYSTSFMITADIEIPDDLKVLLIDKDLKLHQNLQQ